MFRGLDIATAKATAAERARIPHLGLDLVDPDEAFTVADFVRHADAELERMAACGHVALLVGGTGLYLRAVASGLDVDALPHDPEIRARLEADLAAHGRARMATRLAALAPRLAASIDLQNPRRLVRALEIALARGDAPRPALTGYPGPLLWLGLSVAPEVHRAWIATRTRAQFAAGLLDEAAALRARFDPALPAFSAIGYREAWAVLDGFLALSAATELNIQRNVAFARRQATWFRRESAMTWMDAAADPVPAALRLIRPFLGYAAPT